MPLSVTNHFNLNKTEYDKTGALDALLDIDTHFFIDPHLLRVSSINELSQSYKRVQRYFSNIIKLLSNSQGVGDVFWTQASKLMMFPEVQGLCIGYSKKSTSGSGMGVELRNSLLDTAYQIIRTGIMDPEIFELVGLFQEDVGADRISDMLATIILPDLIEYSSRVFKKLSIKCNDLKVNEYNARLPINPFNHKPLILVPKEIIRDLPMAHCWSDIDIVAHYNEKLRNKINQIIGNSWKQAVRIPKIKLKKLLVDNPELMGDLIKQYKNKKAQHYDFERDPSGEIIWYSASRDFASRYPLALMLRSNPTVSEVESVVDAICNKFKELIEDNGLVCLLYDNDKPKWERAAQKLFYGIADAYCSANNLDLSPEANAGRGPVDFKISSGYECKVLVEVKLSSNKNLLSGFNKQLPQYQRSEKTKRGVYLVIDVGVSDKKMKRFMTAVSRAKLNTPKVIFVNGIKQPSASKLR